MKKNTIFKYCASLAMGLALSSSLCASYDVTTVAGVAGSSSNTDGVGAAARFVSPGMMSISNTGNLIIADDDNNVRQVTTAGGAYSASTLFYANPWGEHLEAVCQYVAGGTTTFLTTQEYMDLMLWTQSGGVYVSNTSLDSGGAGYGGGSSHGWGLVVDSSNNIFIADSGMNQIWKILSNGSYSVFASGFNGITGITIDGSNNLYASDTGNNTIRKITPAGVVTTIAGTAGTSGSTDAEGTAARFNSPWDIDIDAAGNLYVADRGNNLIRKLTNNSGTYTVSTIAGLAGSSGSSDGVGSAACFNAPTGLAVDAFGYVFVTDTGNNTIRRLAPPSITIEVDGADSASNSGAISTGILNKTNAGSLALSGANAIGNLDIQGGLVSVSSASNLNGASSAVTFAASGTDPVTSAANTATLEIAGTMNTGRFAFSTTGTVQVDGSNVATLNHAPTGTGLVHKTGAGVMKVASDLSASAALAGIHVDAGTFYVQSGKAPNVPIQIASGALLQLAGVSTAASGTGSEIKSALTVQSGGSIVVDASKKVGTSLTTTVTYTLDTSDGHYKNGSDSVAWPAGLTSVYTLPAYSSEIHWNGNVYGHNGSSVYVDSIYYLSSSFLGNTITYAGKTLECGWLNDHRSAPLTTGNQTYRLVYTGATTYLGSANSDSDAALSGTVLMESGSSIVLGAGSNWARDITVGTAS